MVLIHDPNIQDVLCDPNAVFIIEITQRETEVCKDIILIAKIIEN